MTYHLQDPRFSTEGLTLYTGGLNTMVRMAAPTQSVNLAPLLTHAPIPTANQTQGQQGTPLVVHSTLSIPSQQPGQLPPLQTVPQDATVSSAAPPVRQKPQILEKMKLLRDSGKYCDVVIDVKGRQFRVHKNVLAAWSPYFDHHLFGDGYTSPDLMIVNYDNYEVFSDLLDFLYSGCIAPRETNFLQLLHLAVSFQIDPLRGDCEEYLRSNLHLGNFISTYFLCRKYSLTSLEDFIAGFLQMNLSDAVKQNEFLSLPVGRIHAFLSTGRMEQIKPEVKLFLIISWVGFDVQDRERYLVMLLKHIDWSTVASDFLLEISRTENFFTTHESSLYLLLQTLYSSQISLGPYVELFPALRQTYSHILNNIVQIGIVTPEMETFCPVTVSVSSILNSNTKHDAAVNTEVTGPDVEAAMPTPRRLSITRNVDINSDDSVEGSDQEETGDSTEPTSASTQQQMPRTYLDVQSGTMKMHKRKGMPKKIKLILPVPPKGKQRTTKQKSQKKVTEPSGVTTRSSRSKKAFSEVEDENEEEFNEDVNGDENNLDHTDEEDEENNVETENVDDSEGDKDESSDNEMQTETSYPVSNKSKRSLKRKKSNFDYLPKEKLTRECGICGFTSTSLAVMKEHRVKAHFKNLYFECKDCDFHTSVNREYLTHMRQHFDGPPYRCKNVGCDYSCDKLQRVITHQRSHTEDRPYHCQICNLKLKSRNNLFSHLKTHSENRPFECDVCHLKFRTRNTRDTHLVTHSDERPYLCDLCGFSTKFQSHLISHKRIHTGDVYPCTFPECTYTTPKKSQLKCHYKKHEDLRTNICKICSKAFKEKSHLNRHEKIHSKEADYKCDFCSYTTHRCDKLKYHFKKHHGENATAKTQYRKRKTKETPAVTAKTAARQEFDHAYTMPLPTTYIHDLHGNVQAIPGLLPTNNMNIASMSLPVSLATTLDQDGVTMEDRLNIVSVAEGTNINVNQDSTIIHTHRLSVQDTDHRVIMTESDQRSLLGDTDQRVIMSEADQRLLLQESDHQSYIQPQVQLHVSQSTVSQQGMMSPTSGQSLQAQAGQDYGGLSAFMALF
ncbi:zinc finger Y-chromosomal protein 1-like [Mizuhopecten yessoensis]|uniref:Histone-lysine N-methyltransferase PRDM9 n=1 Tax=Mizuhopecten yessoensis TaxID=6573 RepID=A0A210PXL3_MIZYE|nr:zinc finger Y-chromosomal protein 1-like [Mizuhopecten yessoensis]OWF41199.1 Histone-lysine N-methyltransferase PRDM9 [Mizuhopecten yessoensis]